MGERFDVRRDQEDVDELLVVPLVKATPDGGEDVHPLLLPEPRLRSAASALHRCNSQKAMQVLATVGRMP